MRLVQRQVLDDKMNNWAGMEALYPKKAPIRLQKVLALTVERVLTASQKPKKKEIGESAKNEINGLKMSYHLMANYVRKVPELMINEPEFCDSLQNDWDFFETLYSQIKVTVSNLQAAKNEANERTAKAVQIYEDDLENIKKEFETEEKRISAKKKNRSLEKLIASIVSFGEAGLGILASALSDLPKSITALISAFTLPAGAALNYGLHHWIDKIFDKKLEQLKENKEKEIEERRDKFDSERSIINSKEYSIYIRELALLQIKYIEAASKHGYIIDIYEETPKEYADMVKNILDGQEGQDQWDLVNEVLLNAEGMIIAWMSYGQDWDKIKEDKIGDREKEKEKVIAEKLAKKAISGCSLRMAHDAIITGRLFAGPISENYSDFHKKISTQNTT